MKCYNKSASGLPFLGSKHGISLFTSTSSFVYANLPAVVSKHDMKLDQVILLLQGKLLTKDADLTREVKGGCGADLMSDVLASAQPDAVLLTGLCSHQVVRTAQMADVAAIVIVRGKVPPSETLALAEQEKIPLISTRYGMLESCGRLYQAGLTSLEVPAAESNRT
jgi:hypothetical protein